LRGDSFATWNAENIKRVFKIEHADAAKSAVVLGGGCVSVAAFFDPILATRLILRIFRNLSLEVTQYP
jgi:hypothetical protein